MTKTSRSVTQVGMFSNMERGIQMNILITGGAGFIGINFMHYMRRMHPQARLICFDKLTYAANVSALADFAQDPLFRFVKADICDREAVYSVFAQEHPDAVVHFAAESHVDRSIGDPDLFLQTNVLGTSVLLSACREFGDPRFHHVSTDEVYGDLPLDRPDLRFTEESPLRASSPYSASKAASDLLVLACRRTYGQNVTISRCSNNYGPYQFPEKLIPLMLHNAKNDKELPVYGAGMQIRDWLHVKDHCVAIRTVLEKGVRGEVYNIGGNNERANIEIVNLILDVLNKPQSLIRHVQDRPGHDRRYAIDNTKITTQLGWVPEYTFQRGMSETIEWYLQNGTWVDHVISGDYLDYYTKMYAKA